MFLLPSEVGFLKLLKESRVPLVEFELPANKILNIQSQLEALIGKNFYLNKSAKDGYKAYLHSYASHSLRSVFDVHKVCFSVPLQRIKLIVSPARPRQGRQVLWFLDTAARRHHAGRQPVARQEDGGQESLRQPAAAGQAADEAQADLDLEREERGEGNGGYVGVA